MRLTDMELQEPIFHFNTMADHTRRSAIRSSSRSSSEGDTPGFTNDPTSTNDTAESRSGWWPSNTTLEILQAHLEADADSDSSEADGPRVHPDFFVHLENLRRVNETNRVNARREAEARYQAALMRNPSQYQTHRMLFHSQYEASQMLNESQHEVSRMINESHLRSSQFVNEFNQPSYHAGADHGLQSSAMDMREGNATQDSPTAGPFEPMPHVHFQTTDPMGSDHSRDNSYHHRPPSPYPTESRCQPSTVPDTVATPPMPAPQPRRYTEFGNPYRLPFDPAPFPEGAIPYGPERILQAWLIRQQLIAGIRPENLQPMSQPRGRQHRTPPYIVLNESGAHIIRIEPARFEGTMLPLPALPWLPRRANNNAPTAPVSSNTPDASDLPTAPNIATAPSSASNLNSPAVPNPSPDTTPPAATHLSATLNPPAAPNLSAAPTPSAAANSPVPSHLPAYATLLAALTPPDPPTLPAGPNPASILYSSGAPDLSAAPNSSITPNPPVARTSPAASHLQAAATLLAALTPPAAPPLPANHRVVSDPTVEPGQGSGDLNQHVAEGVEPDPRMVAFFQPLRLHEPANSVSPSVSDARPEIPSTSEPGPNENSQTSVATLHSKSQASMPLAMQNRTDADSISSQEVFGVGVSPAHSQDRESSTISSLSNEGTEIGNVPSPQAPNGNGVVHHAVTWSEPEDPDESTAPRLRRFVIDGVDESIGEGRSSGDAETAGDQSSLGGLI